MVMEWAKRECFPVTENSWPKLQWPENKQVKWRVPATKSEILTRPLLTAVQVAGNWRLQMDIRRQENRSSSLSFASSRWWKLQAVDNGRWLSEDN
ncbi:unnamed protein product [Citrullus colocynthis]|uniref:Uncharacterized protein n=1 Tax=Citrullus colocynthis TaxID=252529 RepID=A0ABP0Y643_9ROSI